MHINQFEGKTSVAYLSYRIYMSLVFTLHASERSLYLLKFSNIEFFLAYWKPQRILCQTKLKVKDKIKLFISRFLIQNNLLENEYFCCNSDQIDNWDNQQMQLLMPNHIGCPNVIKQEKTLDSGSYRTLTGIKPDFILR